MVEMVKSLEKVAYTEGKAQHGLEKGCHPAA
jgi:hypothetical protein